MKVLLTAFEPFGQRSQNSSQICLEILQNERFTDIRVESLILPVTFDGLQDQTERMLRKSEYELAIHLGQTANESRLKLEMFAHNTFKAEGWHFELEAGGEYAYRTDCPVKEWEQRLAQHGVPSFISRHAGLIQCNALYYWSLRTIAVERLRTQSCFIHIPLDSSQLEGGETKPTLLASDAARGIKQILLYESGKNKDIG